MASAVEYRNRVDLIAIKPFRKQSCRVGVISSGWKQRVVTFHHPRRNIVLPLEWNHWEEQMGTGDSFDLVPNFLLPLKCWSSCFLALPAIRLLISYCYFAASTKNCQWYYLLEWHSWLVMFIEIATSFINFIWKLIVKCFEKYFKGLVWQMYGMRPLKFLPLNLYAQHFG